MKVAFLGTATENTIVAMQAIKTMCSLLQTRQKREWLCEKLYFVDCKTKTRQERQEILQTADIVVVNLKQSRMAIEQYFEVIPRYHEKSFYLVHNYMEHSEWNSIEIQKICRIPEERLGILPYNYNLLSTHHRQNIPQYIHHHWNRPQVWEKNYFQELVHISEKIIRQAERKKRTEFFG